MRKVLKGVGNQSMETCFRMNVTLCMQRALTEAEAQQLTCPLDAAIRLAGAPVELLWVKGVTGHTLRPCENVIKHVIDPTRPDLWFPIDCENCEPCEARLQHLRKIGVL